MKRLILMVALCGAIPVSAVTNVAPVVQVLSAAMRPGTTLMDVTYRITDPDDPTVKVRALAFVDGVRSFANVVRPATFVEGTATNIGDAITTGVDHTLTWDVRQDWNIDLAQLKFEVLCRDSRGLLPLDWITIPSATDQPALTISKNAPTDAQLLDTFFWQYAAGDLSLTLTNAALRGNTNNAFIGGLPLVMGMSMQNYSAAYVFRLMNLDTASRDEVNAAQNTARAQLADLGRWHAASRIWSGCSAIVYWGANQSILGAGLTDVVSVEGGSTHFFALNRTGMVIAWGGNGGYGQLNIPAGLTDVTAIASGSNHGLALRRNGTVVAWGWNYYGQTDVPVGLTNIVQISAHLGSHNLALMSNGTVTAWGYNGNGQINVPAGLTGVLAIATGGQFSLALRTDNTVVSWGNIPTPPAGLNCVTAIAAGNAHGLALKSDGTVTGWGNNNYGQISIPIELTNVIAIAAGSEHSLALKSDGTVVAWGRNQYGQTTVPIDMVGVTRISSGDTTSIALKSKAP